MNIMRRISGNTRNQYIIPERANNTGQPLLVSLPVGLGPSDAQWHPSGLTLCIGNAANIRVVNYNQSNDTFTNGQLFAGAATVFEFNKQGDRIAAINGSTISVFQYNLHEANPILADISIVDPELADSRRVAWSPCGNYIAVSNQKTFLPNVVLAIFQYVRSPVSLTRVATVRDIEFVEFNGMDWSNRDIISAVGWQLGLRSYRFNRLNNTLTMVHNAGGTHQNRGNMRYDNSGEFIAITDVDNYISVWRHTPSPDTLTFISGLGFGTFQANQGRLTWDNTGRFFFIMSGGHFGRAGLTICQLHRITFSVSILAAFFPGENLLKTIQNPQGNMLIVLRPSTTHPFYAIPWTSIIV